MNHNFNKLILIMCLFTFLMCSKDSPSQNQLILMDDTCIPNTFYNADGKLSLASQLKSDISNNVLEDSEYFGFCFNCSEFSEDKVQQADFINDYRYMILELSSDQIESLKAGAEVFTVIKYKNGALDLGASYYILDPLPESKIELVEVSTLPNRIAEGVAFALNSEGYLGLGYNPERVNENRFYRFNPSKNEIFEIAEYPVSVYAAFSFVINDIAYVAGGIISDSPAFDTLSNKMYAYDAANDKWDEQQDIPIALAAPSVFVKDNIAYVIGGLNCRNCILTFDPMTNSWANIGAYQYEISAMSAVSTSSGRSFIFENLFQEYVDGAWINKSPCPMPNKADAICFSIDEDIYTGLGWTNESSSNALCAGVREDFWKYDTTNDSWSNIGILDGINVINYEGIGFKIDDEVYLASGHNNDAFSNSIYKLKFTN